MADLEGFVAMKKDGLYIVLMVVFVAMAAAAPHLAGRWFDEPIQLPVCRTCDCWGLGEP